jgi:hypothetical protein
MLMKMNKPNYVLDALEELLPYAQTGRPILTSYLEDISGGIGIPLKALKQARKKLEKVYTPWNDSPF